ncbi:MAG: haloacid dehalogenase-like hydrolase [Roseomonas sp.]|nr:haloacid dehalogenase-like hydrolase [Roseomonas sp.]MCA3281252.1 haloacid dehalogenase-like hydrolase [Roseomonas sp.]MCA3297310.1 haloacid dehalogenase-like hydrolase [Roseomonas sp.]
MQRGSSMIARRSFAALLFALPAAALAQSADPLPSWREGPRKRALLEFVAAVTREGSVDYVHPSARIAVFDNDGTLWVEQPAYVQLLFILDRIRALAPANPAWQQDAVFRAAIAGDMHGAMAGGNEGLMRLAGAAMAGNTPEEFQAIAAEWLKTARHPKWNRPYTALVYQPMLEVLRFLRAAGFGTFIVSGGGVEFVRAFAEETYGIPPHQVVGSSFALTVGEEAGRLMLRREPRVDFIDDGPGKPIGIARHIGSRPIAAFGNSDGDYEMLRYTTEGAGRRLGMIIRHDDAEREFAYDREGHIGRLARALDAAPARGWQVVSMRDDWARVFG